MMTNDFKALAGLINNRLSQMSYGNQPIELYEPIRYIMSLGGKRLRPLLVLMSYQLFKDNPEEVLDQALAVEVFHNFTLMHDDIMDDAPLRRGQQTVHEKWNSNTAILSGDVMLVKAYDLLMDSPGNLKDIIRAFNACAAGVCEGQQFDMNFEHLPQVTEADYLNMIRLKTAVLLGFSLELGAMLAGAKPSESKALYDFGVDVGIGFQLKDDLLDVYGDQKKFGKQVGGDILSNKKTFLLLKALELASPTQLQVLSHWLSQTSFDANQKVKEVTAIYDQIGIKELTLAKMNEYFAKGFERLGAIDAAPERKEVLRTFTQYLIDREK